MNRFILCSCLVVSTLLVCPFASAQDMGIFSGKGIRVPGTQDSTTTSSAAKNRRWSDLMDFSNDRKPSEDRRSRLFGQKPNMDFIKNPFRRSEGAPRLFGTTPAWMPKRDPNAPNILAQMNAKSKDFIDRTHNWAQQKNEDFKARTFGTWDAITRDFRRTPRPDFSNPFEKDFGTQPQMRTTESMEKKPTVRF